MLLLLVLLFVLGSFGLLVTALVTGQTAWAWGSVATSLLAGTLLAVDWLARRRVTGEPKPAERQPTAARTPQAQTAPADAARAEPPTRRAEQPDTEADTDVGTEPGTAPAAEAAPGSVDPAVEPAEEDTDAADVIAISDLTYEVVVIDERPRYHLADCEWLAGRQTIPLPVREARELGFTPCALCTPDAKLAARHRLARR